LKIFLDVGAHRGLALRASLDRRYGFDRVYSFEPAAVCWRYLERTKDSRAVINRFGLSAETADRVLHNPGTLGASVLTDYRTSARTEVSHFVQASAWFRDHLAADDVVYLKMNCEGSECEILDDLLDSGEFAKVHALLVYFDASRSPSMRGRPDRIRKRLEGLSFTNYSERPDVAARATAFAKVQAWLDRSDAVVHGANPTLKDRANHLRFVGFPEFVRRSRAAGPLRNLFPRRLYQHLEDAVKARKR
jgi:FkbM family methyltransferase